MRGFALRKAEGLARADKPNCLRPSNILSGTRSMRPGLARRVGGQLRRLVRCRCFGGAPGVRGNVEGAARGRDASESRRLTLARDAGWRAASAGRRDASETARGGGKTSSLRRRTNGWHQDAARGVCVRRSRARRFFPTSFARGGGRGRHNLFIPSRMVSPRKFGGDIAADYGAKRTALRENTHIDMDEEEANGEQRAGSMKDDRSVAEPAKAPGYVFRKPEGHTAQQQKGAAYDEAP